ncbi:MAG: sulfotransferase family 2 domain-containing protein [Pseudomonadota bacterium]
MTGPNYRYFIIFAAMRTGSNLLERLLAQLGGIETHGELFNPSFVGKPGQDSAFGMTRMSREARPFGLIDRMVQDSDQALPGFRLFSGHDPRVLRRALSDPDCGKIVLSRNMLDSFLSLQIARQTDQWMLNNINKRRDARIRFDAGAYLKYQTDTEGYYASVRRTLQEHGQTAYFIDYSELKELPILNGLAAFLGVEGRFDELKEPILRQNPGAATDKVTNPDDMLAALRGMGGDSGLVGGPESAKRADRGGLRLLRGALTQSILFAAIPGGPEEQVLRWMHGADGGVPTRPDFDDARSQGEIDLAFQNRKALQDWFAERPGAVSFAVVRHPVERALRVFEEKIFLGGEAGFPMIREQLRQNFGMRVPDEADVVGKNCSDLERQGYGAAQHREAFHAFLDFIKANLSGQTSLRTDPRWEPQRSFIDSFNAMLPLTFVLHENQLVKGAAFMKNLLDLGQVKNAVLRTPPSPTLFAMNEIVTAETNKLARAAYQADYRAFGFSDWGDGQAALEASASVKSA